jgi:hypothetical protein
MAKAGFIDSWFSYPEIGGFRTGPPGRWVLNGSHSPGFTRGYFHFLPTGEAFLRRSKNALGISGEVNKEGFSRAEARVILLVLCGG